MNRQPHSRVPDILALAAGVIFGLLALVIALGGPATAPAAAASTGAPPAWTPCAACTPDATHPPCWECTPEATRTPCPTCTPEPTHHPCWECTPEATRTPCPTCTPPPTHTPRPLVLVPRLQFGHARPGEIKVYHDLLLNRFSETTTVDLTGESWRDWPVTVDPTQVAVEGGPPVPIHIAVEVPVSPTHHIDLERIRAVSEGTQPVTATAYLLTLVGRHPFSDLGPDSWADDPVQYLVDAGVVAGYDDGTFRPNANVTRAQFAKMLVGALGWPLATPASPTFSDVPPTFWGYAYIETAVAHGVISGYPDGTFRPAADLTRAQLAKMVVTARSWAMDPPAASPFTDVAPGDWFYSYAAMTNAAQAMGGYADGTFRPYAPATRAQIAKILTLALFNEPDN